MPQRDECKHAGCRPDRRESGRTGRRSATVGL